MKRLLAAFALAAIATAAQVSAAAADIACTVNSPDGELNVRENTKGNPGKVIGTVKNGNTINVLDVFRFNGKVWARVSHKTTGQPVGWMFRDYLNCEGKQQQARVESKPQEEEPKPASSAPVSGERLLSDCTASAKFEPWKKLYCLAYLRGMGDGLITAGVCIGDQTSNDLVDATVPALRRMTSKERAQDATLILPALWDALWPCKEERKS